MSTIPVHQFPRAVRICAFVFVLMFACLASYITGNINGFHRGYARAHDEIGLEPAMQGDYEVSDLVLPLRKGWFWNDTD